MKYRSTRGQAPELSFADVLLAGLARDGGLYVPNNWPQLESSELRRMQDLPYADIAACVMQPFVSDWIRPEPFRAVVEEACRAFRHGAVVPLHRYDDHAWFLELFHGPTFAFKDVALQLLGRLFDRALEERGERITIIGATSGDTGSAAIAGCAGRRNMDVFILFPKGRISEIQRRQMTTVDASNIFCIAIDGTFDDCQALVKAMFRNVVLRERLRLAAVNSINWARIMAQIAYNVAAAVRLGAPDRAVVMTIPSANFGACFAAYAAMRMGVPISRFVVATNANDILHRFIQSGRYETAPVVKTLSPSMDIQISSNFERFLFEMCEREATTVNTMMTRLAESGGFTATDDQHTRIGALMDSHATTDDGIVREIRRIWSSCGILVDPHTACGTAAVDAMQDDRSAPVIVHAQAHPAKFPEAIRNAVGVMPEMPDALQSLYAMPERVKVLPNDLARVQGYIASMTTV